MRDESWEIKDEGLKMRDGRWELMMIRDIDDNDDDYDDYDGGDDDKRWETMMTGDDRREMSSALLC